MKAANGNDLIGQTCQYKTVTKEECLHECQKNPRCNEFEFIPGQHTTMFNCRLFKAVTFDERCAKVANTLTNGMMYTRAGYMFPDETVSKCTHRDLFNQDYDVFTHCNAITTARECTNDDVHIKLLHENTMCDSYDTNRIQSLTDKVYTKEMCNSVCNSTASCVQFAVG
jgi:hypothetical protein